MQELTMERLAALALRGLSFYDSRRWGWTYSIANGGGRYGSTIIYKTIVYTNATIDYNFMDYWDVPADEIDKNARLPAVLLWLTQITNQGLRIDATKVAG